jgi:hypothetical protein
MASPVKRGVQLNFCASYSAHEALREMIGEKYLYVSFLNEIIVTEYARRQARAALRSQLLKTVLSDDAPLPERY